MTMNYIKENVPGITKVEYFTDGCKAQYKNCKSFLNLCYHLEDFGINAEWSFHTTSHGKSECDGIGAGAKRMASKGSLQRPDSDQITTAFKMFEFCSQQKSKIDFFLLSKKQ
jgi:hypothetical protein